ncbi:MAG: TMEM165/GDT1 family protein [Spirochaetota bacterium]
MADASMFWQTFVTVFTTVFLAEIGDKTQLATMLFAANKEVSLVHVFAGSAMALVVASALGVFAGAFLGAYIPTKLLHYAAGAGFVVIGLWTIYRA